MEKAIFDARKIYFIILFFFLLDFIYSALTTNASIYGELKASLILCLIAIPICWWSFSSDDKVTDVGLFFSHEKISILKREKNFSSTWADLKIRCPFKFSKYFYVIIFSFDGIDKDYRFYLFAPTSESFSGLVNKYAPEGHILRNIVAEYNK